MEFDHSAAKHINLKPNKNYYKQQKITTKSENELVFVQCKLAFTYTHTKPKCF